MILHILSILLTSSSRPARVGNPIDGVEHQERQGKHDSAHSVYPADAVAELPVDVPLLDPLVALRLGQTAAQFGEEALPDLVVLGRVLGVVQPVRPIHLEDVLFAIRVYTLLQ